MPNKELDRMKDRIAELEWELKVAHSDAGLDNTARKIVEQENARLQAEIERLREALKRYAKHDCYYRPLSADVAKKALKG